MPDTREALIEGLARAEFLRDGLGGHEAMWATLPKWAKAAWIRRGASALAAIEAAGCVVVPREATEAMVKAAYAADWFNPGEENWDTVSDGEIDQYRPVIAAATAASPFAKREAE